MAHTNKPSRLISMEKPKPRKRSRLAHPVDIDSDKYPWELRFTLKEDQIKKLPHVMKYNVGDEVLLVAKADITGKSLNETQTSKGGDKRDRSLTLQMTDLSISVAKEPTFAEHFDEITS